MEIYPNCHRCIKIEGIKTEAVEKASLSYPPTTNNHDFKGVKYLTFRISNQFKYQIIHMYGLKLNSIIKKIIFTTKILFFKKITNFNAFSL
jgi:hypothetical protein